MKRIHIHVGVENIDKLVENSFACPLLSIVLYPTTPLSFPFEKPQ